MPSHFAKIKVNPENRFDLDSNDDIRLWIKSKLTGRFSIVKMPSIESDGKIKSVRYVGFEDYKELTYFMLACPHIRR